MLKKFVWDGINETQPITVLVLILKWAEVQGSSL